MKSKSEIIKYISSQSWGAQFCKYAFLSQRDLCYDYLLINNAFIWDATSEGYEYWANIAKEYCAWFKSTYKPKSWKEFCEQNPIQKGECLINNLSQVAEIAEASRRLKADRNILPSKEYAEAFLAYMQLIQLRKTWIKNNIEPLTWKIETAYNKLTIVGGTPWNDKQDSAYAGLSFPTWKLANEFLDTFKDLLEVAKLIL